MKKSLIALALAGTFFPFAPVQALTFSYEPGVVHETDAFASFGTTGADMGGTGVHVEYSDGSTHDAIWQSLGAGFGGAIDSAVYITAGATGLAGYPWILYNPAAALAIRSVSLDGQPGNTLFDVSFPFGVFAGSGFVGTTGTSGGAEFDLSGTYRTFYDGISITYSDAVALEGAAPVGDIFRRMKIEFAPTRLLASGALIEFRQDTDSLAFGSVLAPVAPSSVPDGGATLSMLCAGLALLIACGRRRTLTAN